MELPEFHVFKWNACTRCHAHTVAGVDERVCGSCPDAPCAASCENGDLGLENHDFAGFHFKRCHTNHVAIGVANDVQSHPFDEELGSCANVALVQRVQQGVTSTVCRCAGALHRFFAEVRRVTAERTLINGAIRVAVKWHTEVLKFVDDLGRLTAHEFDGILVAQIV